MPIVTLTTDFGWKDPYLPSLKGAMLNRNAQLNIIDITHNINNYDIVQAAFIFRNVWKRFPAGTIHLLSVNDIYSSKGTFVAIAHDDHYFIGPNNGVFSLVFDTLPSRVFRMAYPKNSQFPLQDIYADAVGHIANGKPLEEIGTPGGDLVQRITFHPIITPSQIRGSIIYIDNYDNAIVNITRTLFEEVGKDRPFSVFFKKHDPINCISRNYHDVPIGETLCMFNSSGLLEIAINTGKACRLLGLAVEDTVQIDFHPAPTGQKTKIT